MLAQQLREITNRCRTQKERLNNLTASIRAELANRAKLGFDFFETTELKCLPEEIPEVLKFFSDEGLSIRKETRTIRVPCFGMDIEKEEDKYEKKTFYIFLW